MAIVGYTRGGFPVVFQPVVLPGPPPIRHRNRRFKCSNCSNRNTKRQLRISQGHCLYCGHKDEPHG